MSMLKAPAVTGGEWLPSWYAGTPETIELHKKLGHEPMRMLLNDGGMAIMAGQEDDNPKRICVVDCQADYRRGKGWLTECAERDANARMMGASKKLAEALHAIVDGGLLSCYDSAEFRDKGNCAHCRGVAALLAAGYVEEP